jgi:anaerobic ribonucleoside-triphosphate reductase activating protein
LNYATIKKRDIANGVGVRVSLFVSGCRHYCRGCFNREAWDFLYGEAYTAEIEEKILSLLAPDYISGLSLLGGEPFEPEHQPVLIELLKKMKARYPQKNVWCYTGFTLEELLGGSRARTDMTDEMLSYIDVLVDGRFVEEKRNLSLRFRGSENQRLLNLKETLKAGQPVLWGT